MAEYSIALGVTGSIAAYKAAGLCSQLVKDGHEVIVFMTGAAQKLVGPHTFLTLSQNPVITDLWDIPDWRPGHIAVAERVDLLAVVPCTANFIGKYAHGIADDALTTFALSHTEKVLLAPAMNPRMWNHPAVKANCEILKKRGVQFAGPVPGDVACGITEGAGRMAEVTDIHNTINQILK